MAKRSDRASAVYSLPSLMVIDDAVQRWPLRNDCCGWAEITFSRSSRRKSENLEAYKTPSLIEFTTHTCLLIHSTIVHSKWTSRSSHSSSIFIKLYPHITHLCQTLQPFPPLSTVQSLIVDEKQGNCVPVFIELPADLLTPCAAYLRISKDSKYSFLLESVASSHADRYCFIGAGKFL